MDDMFFWMILAAVVSVIGSLLSWGILFFGILKGAKYLNQQFEHQLRNTEALHQQWARMTPQERAAKTPQMAQAFSQLNQRFGQLDNIARQRYDNRVGELMGMAGSAGIDWHP